MANQKWDRTIINPRERPLSSDINQAQAQLDRTLRDMLMTFFSGRVSEADASPAIKSGCIGAGLQVLPQAVPNMSVRLRPGIGFLDLPPADTDFALGGIGGLDDLSEYKPIVLLSELTISGIAAPVTNPRIDIIEVRMNRVAGNPLSRDVLDTISGLFVSNSVNKSLAFTLDGSQSNVLTPALSTGAVGYKRGAEAASPVAPAVTAGYMKIAEVRLPVAALSIQVQHVCDFRRILAPNNIIHVTSTWSIPSTANPPVLTGLIAPPGFKVGMYKFFPPGISSFVHYVFGGGYDGDFWPGGTSTARAAVFASVGAGFTAISESFAVQGINPFIDQSTGLTLGEQTTLAAPASAYPGTLLPIGQPYVSSGITVMHQNGATTDTTIPSPLVLSIETIIRL